MKGYAIFMALFIFSLCSNVVTNIGVTDADGVEHKVYDVALPNQHLNMSEEDAAQFTESAQTPSAIDIMAFVGFALFKMLPMLLSSVWQAFYVAGWLGAWGVPPMLAWCFQVPLWIIYSWEVFQIITNRSIKSYE